MNEILLTTIEEIAKNPQFLILIFILYLFGYAIAFLLFSYHRESSIKNGHILNVAIGTGAVALVFVVMNMQLFFDNESITSEEIARKLPESIIMVFALLFIIFIVATLFVVKREQQIDQDKKSQKKNNKYLK
ncbi:MAG: hypothetical protein AB4372_25665 [Xenococcus sp. (in: cyanobacteria)]